MQSEVFADSWLQWQANYEEEPPVPQFNWHDDEKCRERVNFLYEEASKSFSEKQLNNAKLQDSFQDILDKQAKYDVELVNNEDFFAWTVSDWSMTWYAKQNPDAVAPKLDYNMVNVFVAAPNGSGLKKIRSTELMEQAIDTLYYFRNANNMEDDYINEEEPKNYSYEEHASCSNNTKTLADILIQYSTMDQWDTRIERYYPLLDRLVKWLDDTYGGKKGKAASKKH